MKKIFTFFAFALITASCSTEEANVNQYEAQDINKMADGDFINFMETIAIDRNVIPYEINPEDSFYPFPIESITSVGDAKSLIEDPSFGACIAKDLILPGTGDVGNLVVDKFNDNNGNGNGNGNTKIRFKYNAAPGWYIYSISMNIVEDCNNTPMYNGEPDVCAFNVRNCFSGTRTGVTYTFRDYCIPDCVCLAAYVVMYTLNEDGSVDQCVGVWVDGEQLGTSNTAKSNTFCKDTCGETQAG